MKISNFEQAVAACVAAALVIHRKGKQFGGKQVMADAIALIDDIFFLAKVHETAKHTGVTLETASTGEQLLKAAAASPAALILVDLNARQGAMDAVERLCAENNAANGAANASGNPRRVIAFLSHVQTDLAERARAAGCADVMPRSKFTQNLAEILRGAKS
jgi:DNA-binding NarL/FixJ family response regulator